MLMIGAWPSNSLNGWWLRRCGERWCESSLGQVSPNVITFATAISACVGQPTLSLALLDTMLDSNIRPNEIAYTSAISTCATPS